MDDEIFRVMHDKKENETLTKTILETYFSPEIHDVILDIHAVNIGAYSYAKQLELIAAEPFKKYHAVKESPQSYSWQKKQQRKYGFGLRIRNNYTDKCALCRASIKTPRGESLVEGAHIIPWSKSNNDDPRNGLALCKTHHWMFDSYLLTIKPDYRIKLSQWLKTESERIDNTISLDKTKILLPADKRYLPNKKALNNHYNRFNKN
jgi:putative restriction endonuclease